MIEWIIGAILMAITALGIWVHGKRAERDRKAKADARAYQKTMEAINEVVPAPDADLARASLRARLRERPVHGIGTADE